MSGNKKVRTFRGNEAQVTWDGRLCIHVGECGRAEGSLFMSGRQPWCEPDAVAAEQVAEVVRRCPTGALVHHAPDGSVAESPDESNTVVVAHDGPLYVRGDLEVDGAPDNMPGVRFRAAFCRCGHSGAKPFCDNSHREAGFRDAGAVGPSGPGIEAKGGKLAVTRIKDGPLIATGNFSIYSGSGRRAWQGTRAALCRCGASNNKPFCDGAHHDIGFEAE